MQIIFKTGGFKKTFELNMELLLTPNMGEKVFILQPPVLITLFFSSQFYHFSALLVRPCKKEGKEHKQGEGEGQI